MAFEVVCKAADLAVELALARSVVARKVTIPVLAHALLTVEKGRLGISATDIDTSLVTDCAAAGAGKGQVTVDIDRMLGIMKTMGDNQVKLSNTDDKKLSVVGDGFRGVFPSLSPEDFPAIAAPSGSAVALGRANLAAAIARTRFATASGDTRYFLDGLLIDLDKAGSVLVGADGRRVAVASIEAKPEAPSQSIIPSKCIAALLAMLEGEGDEPSYVRGENHLFFVVGRRTLLTRVVDGQFPPYRKVLPQVDGAVPPIVVPREPLLAVLRRLRIVASDGKKGVAVAFEQDRMRLGVNTEDATAEQEVQVTYSAAPRVLGLSGSYVGDFLEAASGPQVTLRLGASAEATMLWEADEGYRYALAPMRL